MPTIDDRSSNARSMPIAWLAMIGVLSLPLLASPALAQQNEPASAATPSPDSSSSQAVTVSQIDALAKEVEESTDLEDVKKTEIKETLTKAKAELAKATAGLEEAAKYRSWMDNAESDKEDVTRQKETLAGYDLEAATDKDLPELKSDRNALEQRLDADKQELTAAQTESQRRVGRLAAIPNEVSAATMALEKVQEELVTLRSGDPSSIAARARLALADATRQARASEIKLFSNERDAYQAQDQLPRLRRDLLTARVRQQEQDLLQLINLITERRRTDAAEQLAQAESAFKTAPDSLKPFADENVRLAQKRIELATSIREAAALGNRVESQVTRWKDDYQRTKKRTESLGSDSLGITLAEKRSSLPSTALLSRTIREGKDTLVEYQRKLYELEDRRAQLSDLDGAVADAIRSTPSILTKQQEQLRALLNSESQILDSYLNDSNRHYSLRIATRERQQELIDVINEYREFIDRHLFWTKTAEPLQRSHLVDAGAALGWLFNLDTASAALSQIGRTALGKPTQLLLSVAIVTLLLLYRVRIQTRLHQLGDVASKVSCQQISPTLRAMVLTVLLAVTGPAILWILAWIFEDSASVPLRAVAETLIAAGWWWFVFDFIRKLGRPEGLAQAHFGWTVNNWPVVNQSLRLLVSVGTPLMFLGGVFQRHGDPTFRASIGRICLIALLLLISWCAWRVVRANVKLSDGDDDSILKKPELWRRTVAWTSVLTPIGLATSSALGYHYSAFELTLDFLQTFLMIGVALIVRAVLFRFVRVARRRIRRQQLIESLQNRSESEGQAMPSDIDALISKEGEADLVAMDRQTKRLISMLIVIVALFSLAAIWMEVLPALTPILSVPINPLYSPDDLNPPVTIGSLLVSMGIVLVTIAAWRNIPGLIDVLLLGRLGVESSIRYAITTLSQYAIGIVGVIFACKWLGMTWASVQWLVAAMSVGLGFGLQEVVANFVCGVILLFERPIRVGDIVTLGDTTGVVVRIRSRATTVRNWDRQEVVIPNKELITGRITNWTLSDDMNRVVLPIGVAYGTDTEHVRRVLLNILADNDNILDDPGPLVTFEQFGDSTLNFIVRAFLANMDNRMETIHQLHTSVHQRFNEEGIEIAFPQQDLHVRSVDPRAHWPDATLEADG